MTSGCQHPYPEEVDGFCIACLELTLERSSRCEVILDGAINDMNDPRELELLHTLRELISERAYLISERIRKNRVDKMQ